MEDMPGISDEANGFCHRGVCFCLGVFLYGSSMFFCLFELYNLYVFLFCFKGVQRCWFKISFKDLGSKHVGPKTTSNANDVLQCYDPMIPRQVKKILQQTVEVGVDFWMVLVAGFVRWSLK